MRIPVRLDPDLIGQIRMFERIMAVHSQLDFVKSTGSENSDFISMDALLYEA
jgi:hypothetical protein